MSLEQYFPKKRPYPNQQDAMEQIEAAFEEGVDVAFEGACGTGKTLSALVPALDHARREDKAVVITTNVHQQMRQFVQEAREIKQMEPGVTATVFKGKTSMCHLDVGYDECEALRDNTYDLVELEGEIAEMKSDGVESGSDVEALEAAEDEASALRNNMCDYFHGNLVDDTRDFHSWLKSDVRSPEQVFERAEEHGYCGYELLKEGMDEIDLVVCNYHHLLSPDVRQYFFRWLDRSPDEVIAVFDEAHNLEDAARDHSSESLALETVERAELELVENGEEELRDALALFRETVESAVDAEMEFGAAESGAGWNDVHIADDDGDEVSRRLPDTDEYRDRVQRGLKFAAKLDNEYEREYKEGDSDVRRECPSLAAFAFVDSYLRKAGRAGHLPVAGVRRGAEGLERRLELFVCVPSEVTEPLFDGLHSSVLMSATLRPFDVLEDTLGLHNPLELAYPLEFPSDRRETYTVDLPPLFSRNRDDPETVAEVSAFVEDVVETTPGNSLFFFPSASEAERYHGEVELDGDVDLLLDRSGERAEPLRRKLEEDGKKALFTYLWGTLTEGVDYPGDVARVACVVGVGYPYLDERRNAVQDAYDERFGDGWKHAVESPTIRKTRQALGRVIRSPDDYGVRILADRRYTEDGVGRYNVRDAFPEEEREEFVDVEPGNLRYALYNFWNRMDVADEIELE